MESSVQFQVLEQYAKQHTCFSALADSEPDFYEQYVQALHERGYTEDDVFVITKKIRSNQRSFISKMI